MAASFTFLRDIRPYKTSWRVQVKVLHSWRQYTNLTGETLELVVADAQVTICVLKLLNYHIHTYLNTVIFNHMSFLLLTGYEDSCIYQEGLGKQVCEPSAC